VKAGWTTATLSEVCEFQRGLTYAKSDEVDTSRNVVLRANNIDLVTNRLDLTDLRFISDAVVIPAIKRVRRDSLLVCTASGSKAHLGKVAFIDTDYDFAFGGFMGQLTPGEQVLPKFLFYMMISEAYKDFIASLSDGANINNLKFTDLGRFRIPIPPLPEQRRIVALLDEAFAGLATAAANAERNLDNARELFESHLAEVFSRRGDGWVERRLGEIVRVQNGYAFKSDDYGETGYFVVRIGNVQDGKITLDNPRFIQLRDKRLERFVLDSGDILVSLTGNIGRVGEVRPEHLPAVLNQRVARLTVGERGVSRDFVFWFLRTRLFSESLQRAGHGAAQQNVSTAEIAEVQVWIPESVTQQALVQQLDVLSDETGRLSQLCEQKQAALAALKRSLLHQAFNGEL